MFQPRFEVLRERLLRAGIAPRHVQRYLAELADHLDDLVAEATAGGLTRAAAEAAARARLGGDDALAAGMLARPGLRSAAARWPWAVFCLGPVLLLAGTVAAAMLIEGGLLYWHSARAGGAAAHALPSAWLRGSITAWNAAAIYAAPPTVAAALCLIGLRQRMASGWIVAAIAIVSVIGEFHELGVTWSELPGQSQLYVGFSLAPPYSPAGIAQGLCRAALNLAVAGAFYWSCRIRRTAATPD